MALLIEYDRRGRTYKLEQASYNILIGYIKFVPPPARSHRRSNLLDSSNRLLNRSPVYSPPSHAISYPASRNYPGFYQPDAVSSPLTPYNHEVRPDWHMHSSPPSHTISYPTLRNHSGLYQPDAVDSPLMPYNREVRPDWHMHGVSQRNKRNPIPSGPAPDSSSPSAFGILLLLIFLALWATTPIGFSFSKMALE